MEVPGHARRQRAPDLAIDQLVEVEVDAHLLRQQERALFADEGLSGLRGLDRSGFGLFLTLIDDEHYLVFVDVLRVSGYAGECDVESSGLRGSTVDIGSQIRVIDPEQPVGQFGVDSDVFPRFVFTDEIDIGVEVAFLALGKIKGLGGLDGLGLPDMKSDGDQEGIVRIVDLSGEVSVISFFGTGRSSVDTGIGGFPIAPVHAGGQRTGHIHAGPAVIIGAGVNIQSEIVAGVGLADVKIEGVVRPYGLWRLLDLDGQLVAVADAALG